MAPQLSGDGQHSNSTKTRKVGSAHEQSILLCLWWILLNLTPFQIRGPSREPLVNGRLCTSDLIPSFGSLWSSYLNESIVLCLPLQLVLSNLSREINWIPDPILSNWGKSMFRDRWGLVAKLVKRLAAHQTGGFRFIRLSNEMNQSKHWKKTGTWPYSQSCILFQTYK
jgi:hypothetical protein